MLSEEPRVLVRPIAQLFEGESAMLWMYVIVLMVLMTLG